MKTKKILFFLFIISASINFSQTTFINFGTSWKYKDDGSDQGTNWRNISFSDASWSSGNSELGFGDNDEATIINSGQLTYYFRKSFNLNSLSGLNHLTLDLVYDDGAIVYLNGTEIARVNMPSGTVNYNDPASGGSIDNDTYNTTTIPLNLLNVGNNVIAVEVHNSYVSSSDISFNLKLVGSSSIGPIPNLERGPYLQTGTPNSMIVKWRTTQNEIGRVIYGTSVNNLNMTVNGTTNTKDHEIQLTGLSPYTKYYYAICTQTDTILGYEDNSNYFFTSPPVGDKAKKRIWVLGDAGTADNKQRKVRDAYYNFQNNYTDLILQLGDNAYQSGTDSEFQLAMFEDMYEDILRKSVVWSCIGNHEAIDSDPNNQSGPYYDIYTFPKNGEAGGLASGTESYYSFDYGNIHFIVLSSPQSNLNANGPMLTWAQNDIQNTTQDWIVALFHHPPYSKGSHDSDNSYSETKMRENALPILEASGVDLVLSGHSHSYERSYLLNGHYDVSSTLSSSMVLDNTSGEHSVDCAYLKTNSGTQSGKGAVYITGGSSGKISTGYPLNHPAMHYSRADLGSMYLEVEDNRMDIKFIDEFGNVDDDLTIMKNVGKSTDLTVGAGSVVNLNASWIGNYVWTNGASTKSIAYTVNNSTTIYVEDQYGCLKDTFNITAQGSVSTPELAIENQIKLFPNPIKKDAFFDISFQKEHKLKNIKVIDIAGKTFSVDYNEIDYSTTRVTTENLTSGSYKVIISLENSTITKNLVIN